MMPMTVSTIARPRRRGGGEAGVVDGVLGPTSPDNGADWTGTHSPLPVRTYPIDDVARP